MAIGALRAHPGYICGIVDPISGALIRTLIASVERVRSSILIFAFAEASGDDEKEGGRR
jgi:hypothetical protein